MTLADFFDVVAARRKTLIIYASEERPDVAAHFATRNVTVKHESIAPGGPGGFVVLRDDEEFLGAFGLEALTDLLTPPLFRPWDTDIFSEPWHGLYEILNDALFASFDKRQLLAATREIENRAWRVGDGTLHVGFQSIDAYHSQLPVYRRFVTETDLAVHVYLAEDDASDTIPEIEVHSRPDTEIGRYWFLVFDAAGDKMYASALLAEERSPGSFYGFWTYDIDRVDAMASYLSETYG